jgi:hypothetical protein
MLTVDMILAMSEQELRANYTKADLVACITNAGTFLALAEADLCQTVPDDDQDIDVEMESEGVDACTDLSELENRFDAINAQANNLRWQLDMASRMFAEAPADLPAADRQMIADELQHGYAELALVDAEIDDLEREIADHIKYS